MEEVVGGFGEEYEVRKVVRKLVKGDEVIRIGRIFFEETGRQILSGGRSVKEREEQIVPERFGEQEDLCIREVKVVKEAVGIKDVGRREAVCRSIVAESGVKIGE